ncbi:hemerythrin domain-containing protein [Allorhizocola rhizosphaerae]|uniref:hemerythrin domain-containing protein n=1 Tax=Allorhizocola rhizosphaerae TaxID=1872709 RepID=UPI000E3C090A|nr:hemerythrin domain-containing protein [Allorhizocola rhizosphaerae]
MSGRLDMTAMYALHNALRRELEHIAKITANAGDDPRIVLANAVGWGIFKKALHIHHSAEDEALWPAMRDALADRPGDLALLDAMEAEHAAIDPLIEAIDAALADRDSGPERVGELSGVLVDALSGHLRHEEGEALPLIEATLTLEQWQHFGVVSGKRIGPDASLLTPWMLDDADEPVAARMLALLPEPVRAAYRDQWQPAYAALDRWNPGA